jgi:hypothetical protein
MKNNEKIMNANEASSTILLRECLSLICLPFICLSGFFLTLFHFTAPTLPSSVEHFASVRRPQQIQWWVRHSRVLQLSLGGCVPQRVSHDKLRVGDGNFGIFFGAQARVDLHDIH